MPITDELLYSTTPASNTTLGSLSLDGSVMKPSEVDNAFRELMSYRAKVTTRHVVKTVGSYTPVKADHNQFWRCTGAVTLNLTAAATLTDGWCLWVRANGGAVTIDPNGAETIDGAATLVLADGQQALIICTGSTFYTEFTTSVLTQPTLTLKQGTAPTAEGDAQWNAATNALLVGDGAATKTFRANEWEHISTQIPSAVASVVWTGLSAYRRLKVTGWLAPATDGVTLGLQTDANGGASYDAGASDYQYTIMRSTPTVVDSAGTAGATSIIVSPITVGNAVNEMAQFEFVIENFNVASQCFVNGVSSCLDATGVLYTGKFSGKRLDSNARDAFRLIFSSGNVASGYVTLQGIRG